MDNSRFVAISIFLACSLAAPAAFAAPGDVIKAERAS